MRAVLYSVLQTVTFGGGAMLSLDEKQFALREHRVDFDRGPDGKPMVEGDGRINVALRELLEFKKGEVVGIFGILPKAMSMSLATLDEAGAAAAAAAAEAAASSSPGKPRAPRPPKAAGKPSPPSQPIAVSPAVGPKGQATA